MTSTRYTPKAQAMLGLFCGFFKRIKTLMQIRNNNKLKLTFSYHIASFILSGVKLLDCDKEDYDNHHSHQAHYWGDYSRR